MATIEVSGVSRLLEGTTAIATRLSPASATVSNYTNMTIVVPDGVSDFVVSLAHISVMKGIVLTANQLVHVNFAGRACAFSAGSAGLEFKELFAIVASGGSITSALHFSNSAGNSATINIMLAH